MADRHSADVRSRIMRRIKGKDTGPELRVRRHLHREGLRYRVHLSSLPGKPDLVFTRKRVVIFVHGCFWHQHPGCVHSGVPLSNRNYWEPKLARTVERDRFHRQRLRSDDWHVITLWECEINEARLGELVKQLNSAR